MRAGAFMLPTNITPPEHSDFLSRLRKITPTENSGGRNIFHHRIDRSIEKPIETSMTWGSFVPRVLPQISPPDCPISGETRGYSSSLKTMNGPLEKDVVGRSRSWISYWSFGFFKAYFQGRTLVKLVQKCSVLAFFQVLYIISHPLG